MSDMKKHTELTVGAVHGITCKKVIHTGDGYLHSEHDDDPYDIDGQIYCGRCHHYLGKSGKKPMNKEAERDEQFEMWLRTVCFQSPTPEAYDLALCAWKARGRTITATDGKGYEDAAKICDALAASTRSKKGAAIAKVCASRIRARAMECPHE